MPIGLPLFADSKPFLVDSPPTRSPAADPGPFLVCGVQFDGSSSFRSGSRHAPDAIRAASYNFETYNPSLSLDMREIPVYDCGNIFEVGDIGQVRAELETLYSAVSGWAPGFVPVVIGGEHSISPVAVDVLLETRRLEGSDGREERSDSREQSGEAGRNDGTGRSDGAGRNDGTGKNDIGIIVLDAHLDYRDSYLGNTHSHACALRRFTEVAGTGNVVAMGVRSVDVLEMEEADDDRLRFFTTEEIMRNGLETSLSAALAHLDTDHIYLSLDMDFLDPSFAPGVGTPEHLGLTPRDAIHIFRAIGSRIVGFDLVEVCPPFDTGGITSILAAKLVREMIFSVAGKTSGTSITGTVPGVSDPVHGPIDPVHGAIDPVHGPIDSGHKENNDA